ncbi:uncharacterized protein GGS22DRAFT_168156 [Annulohypoxylon maeteangense]|uniref:uncharacterized protein n=1 Tax=Annulohypoxylon maeteangense TaxID=1927788 RepID=UPI0020074617|nr:uncharacterized protein GGS22DRAFT_168156 [Annulohypoxylon maeteangense]KAI0883215.1 hypothetical protein GGS22DRAFT_168156 [Annulohypoxylon maeteangense]
MSAVNTKSHISKNRRQRDQGSQPPPSPIPQSQTQRQQQRQRPTSKSKKRKLTHATSKAETEGENKEEYNDWFAIRGIINEKVEHGKIYYLVDWEGTDDNGRPHIPSWEPEDNVSIVAISAWEKSRTGAKHKQNTSDVAVSNTTHSTQTSYTGQRELLQVPVRPDRENLVGDRTVFSQIQELTFGEEAARNQQLTEVKTTHSKSAEHGIEARVPLEVLSRRNNIDLGKGTLRSIQEPQKTQKAQKVVELVRDPLFGPNQYCTLSSQGSSGQQQGHDPETKRDVNQVIPDSQAFSGASITETQSSIFTPLDSFGTNQAQGEAFASSRQSSENHQLKSHSHSIEIPSHQVDYRFPGIRENLSGSALVNESSLGFATSNNSQGTASRGHSSFLARVNLSLDSVPSTGQPNNCASIHQRESPSDEHISVTSVSQDQIFAHSFSTASQQSSFQAAQVVVPLSSQQGGLVTRSHSYFTVYDDDVVIPDTLLRNSQAQCDSQDSSQGLGELDDSIRNISSFKDHQSNPQPIPSYIELLQSNLNKPTNSVGEEESSVGQPNLANSGHSSNLNRTPRHQAATTNMDSAEPGTQLSARERLRLIREKSFASLQKPSTILTTTSEDPIQVEPKIDTLAEPQSAIPDPQAIEVPPRPDISPLTPPPIISTFPSQPPEAAQNELTSNMQQPAVPDTSQALIEPEKQVELILEEAGPADVGFGANEEQPGTLDPSNLTLSIENDVEINNLLSAEYHAYPAFGMEEEDELPPANYPKNLHPYVPTGHNEFLITLPFYSNCRPVYNDVLRENEGLIREYNASFLVLPHLKPHPTIISKVDEMFSRLLDICDLPPFMETIPTMSPDEMTKHVVGTNAKFAFIDELLTCLADVKSDKKILILSRPGKAMDLLDQVVKTRGYRYIRSGDEIVGSSTARHSLTVAISSTLDKPSSILEDVEAVIAFDHTYRPELLPSPLRERSPILMVLTNACSIQHLNMRISESIEPLERKNVLVLALVKAMRYIEDVGSSQITQLHSAAELFSDYIQDQDNDDFYWEPLEVPENVFEDLHASSQLQASIPQPDLQGLEIEQASGNRKRSHDVDEDDETSSKRPRVSQPTVVTNVSHISDSLKGLLRDDAVDSPKAMLSVSVGKLEILSTKIATLKTKLKESKQREQQLRQLSDRSKKEVDGYASTINTIQANYMNALRDRGIFEDDYNKAKEETRVVNTSLESSRKEASELKEKNTELQKQLTSANESLLSSANPELAKMAQLEKSLEEAKAEIQKIEKRATMAKNDMEYAKNAYQNASQRAGELGVENRALEAEIELLRRKADENIVKVNQINNARQIEELVRLLNEQKSIVHDRDAELGKVKDELRQLKENRRGTRQNSVPRSPRLSAFNSPRNGGGRVKGGSSSRGTSPAPPPTGVFEAGSGTPVAGRASHLRETRF